MALHLPIAGPTSRMLAYGIDLAAVGAIGTLLLLLLLLATPLDAWLSERLGPVADPTAARSPRDLLASSGFLWLVALVLLAQLALEFGYFVFFERVLGGRSPGKAWVGLRVIGDAGEPVTLAASLVRNLLRGVDILPGSYVVGLVAMVVSAEGKRLGDLAAGTLVVRLDRPERASPLPEEDESDPRFRFDRAEIVRLGRDGEALARKTLRRAATLPEEVRAVVLARATEVLCRRLGREPVPEPEQAAFLRALLRAAR